MVDTSFKCLQFAALKSFQRTPSSTESDFDLKNNLTFSSPMKKKLYLYSAHSQQSLQVALLKAKDPLYFYILTFICFFSWMK